MIGYVHSNQSGKLLYKETDFGENILQSCLHLSYQAAEAMHDLRP